MPQEVEAEQYHLEMKLPSKRVTSRMFQTFKRYEDELVEDFLGVRAVQSASIKVAG